jgi:hypothetical protein
MGFSDVAHAEYDPYASNLIVQPLSCSLKGKVMAVQIGTGFSRRKSLWQLHRRGELLLQFRNEPCLPAEAS